MAEIVIKDRVPQYPNRKLITPEGGAAPFYARVEYADAPVEEGTPVNKALFDSILVKVDGKSSVIRFTATISATWTGSAAPYTQTVTVTGMLATDFPHLEVIPSTDNETAKLQKAAYNLIGKGIPIANGITFTCFEEKPAIAIPVQIEVNRPGVSG